MNTLHSSLDVRSIESIPPITPTRMHGGRPVLLPNPSNDWESRVVLNAAAVLVEEGAELERMMEKWNLDLNSRKRLRHEGGACVLLYRAQGIRDETKGVAPSHLGLAILTPTLELVVRWPDPVIRPDKSFHNLGVEDARCTKVGDLHHLYYTGYATDEPTNPDGVRRVRICLATTIDFIDWELHGPLPGEINNFDNKNPGLFPVQVAGKWLLLHRPMSGKDPMTIHLAEADYPAGPWTSRGRFMESYRYTEFVESWIGAGGPPIATDDGRFVVVYHQGHYDSNRRREYDLAVALVDFEKENPVVARIEPLLRPSAKAEQVGDPELGVDNVLFTCANYRWRGELIIPYAGADSRIFGASVSFARLVEELDAIAT